MSDQLTITVDRSTLLIEAGAIPVETGGGSVGPDLTYIEALTGTGIACRTASDTWALRQLVDSGGGIGITNPAGVAGNITVALDAGLLSLAGVDTGADLLPYTTGANTWTGTALTSFARTLLDDADAATARATLGVGGAAWTSLVKSSNQTVSNTTVTDVTDLGFTPDANSIYQVEVMLACTSSGSTIGHQWGIYAPATGTTDSGQLILAPSAINAMTIRAGNAGAIAAPLNAPTTTFLGMGWAWIKTGSPVSGQIRPAFASEGLANDVTVLAGSQLRYRKIQ